MRMGCRGSENQVHCFHGTVFFGWLCVFGKKESIDSKRYKVLADFAASFIVVARSAGNTSEATAKAFIEKS